MELSSHSSKSSTEIAEAIRLLCNKLYIKGEIQQIDTILETFRDYYIIQNPDSTWKDADIAHIISLAITLLNACLQTAEINVCVRNSQFVDSTKQAVQEQLQENTALNSPTPKLPPLDLGGPEKRWISGISREVTTIYHRVRARSILQMGYDRPSSSPKSKACPGLLKRRTTKLFRALRREKPDVQAPPSVSGISCVFAPSYRVLPSTFSPALQHGVSLDDNKHSTAPVSRHNTQYVHDSEGIARQITSEDVFQCLVAHGCINLSSHMDPDQYSSGLIIGGGFGDIWKGKLRDGTEVAIKVWRFRSILENGTKPTKRAMREIYNWSKAKHQNIQELMGVIIFQGRLGMVSLWMDHGNLREYMDKYPGVDRYTLCVQVARGVLYLHNCRMVHGDLKAANILVSRDGIAKLSDFDHSIMAECSLVFSETSKQGGGTIRWMAPELILNNCSRRSMQTDIYALGMTMLEIVTGTSPYYPECREDVHVIMAVTQKRLPKRQTTNFGNNSRDNQMWELLLRCWHYEPADRPKATNVLESLNAFCND